ncbi:keratin, type II cytoskeletal 8-like [Pangshura tecta]
MSVISVSKKYRSSPHNFSSQSYAFTGRPRMSPVTYAISSAGGRKFRGARSPLGLGRSGGAGIGGSLVAVNFNRNLMNPIETWLKPEIQRVKVQEKEQIKTLNNKFAHFIDKVRTLEQQNEVLKTKWSILQGQKTGPSNMENMFKVQINSLKKQLEDLGQQRVRLESEQGNMQDLLEEFKRNFSSCGAVWRSSWLRLGSTSPGALRGMELRELQADVEMSNTPVVISVDSSPELDVDSIIAEARYEEIQEKAGRHGEELRAAKAELNELNWMIQRIRMEIAVLKEQVSEETAGDLHVEGGDQIQP